MQQQINLYRGIRISSICDRLICVLLLVPYFPPNGLLELIDMRWSAVWITGFVILLLLSVNTLRHIERSFILYGLFYVSITVSTLLNGREVFPAFVLAGKMISFLLLFHYYSYIGKLRCLIQTMKVYMGIMIILTLLIQITNKEIFGFTPSRNIINFIDSDNFLGYYYIPFILLVYFSNLKRSKSYQVLDLIFWISICLISLINAWSATCLTIFIVYIVLLLFRKWKIFNLINPLIGFITNAGISILLIGFQIQKYFKWIIVDILHKDLTLSSRTYVWGSAVTNFLKKPILGYGTTPGGRLDINSYSIGLKRYTFFSHNVFLEVLIQGGIVAMVFFALLYIAANSSMKETKQQTEIEYKNVIFISLFSILLMQFSEFAIYIPIANLPLILCFFYDKLIEEGFERAPYSPLQRYHGLRK